MKGVNYNLGRSLPEMSLKLPHSKVESYELENKITLGQYKPLAVIRFAEMGNKLISAGLITEEVLLNWNKEIQLMPVDDNGYFVNLGTLTCVLVEKRKDD